MTDSVRCFLNENGIAKDIKRILKKRKPTLPKQRSNEGHSKKYTCVKKDYVKHKDKKSVFYFARKLKYVSQ